MDTNAVGRRRWAIAEGYIPGWSNGPEPQMESHETCCILNAGDDTAHIGITVYFADREPAGPYRVEVPARRTSHLRFNELRDPEEIPKDTPFASIIESDVPVVVQHTRLELATGRERADDHHRVRLRLTRGPGPARFLNGGLGERGGFRSGLLTARE